MNRYKAFIAAFTLLLMMSFLPFIESLTTPLSAQKASTPTPCISQSVTGPTSAPTFLPPGAKPGTKPTATTTPKAPCSTPQAKSVSPASQSAASVAAAVAPTCTGGSTYGFSYPSFGVNYNQLCFVGATQTLQNSQTSPIYTRLTFADNTGGDRGGMWYAQKQTIAEGFQTEFAFRISGNGTNIMGDGFTFIIQASDPTQPNQGTSAIGEGGCQLGYDRYPNDGIPHSLAVEFDTYINDVYCPESNDPPMIHIAVHSKGANPNSKNHPTPIPLDKPNNTDWGFTDEIITSGVTKYVRITYVPTPWLNNDTNRRALYCSYPIGGSYNSQVTGVLRVYVDEMPIFSKCVDLSGVWDSQQKAWVGFTASQAVATENHDIISWDFTTVQQATKVTKVTTGSDNGAAGTLRSIINGVQNNGPSNALITFDQSITTVLIDPTRGPIPINADITIDGGGLAPTDLNDPLAYNFTIVPTTTGNTSSAFQIRQGTSVFAGFRIGTFSPPNASGAAIDNGFVDGGTQLTLMDMFLYGNKANNVSSGTGRAGGIWNRPGSVLKIANSRFSSNRADAAGGAIYVSSGSGEVDIDGSTFNDNQAGLKSSLSAMEKSGGAIADANPSGGERLFVFKSTFELNVAYRGGALYTKGTPLFNNDTFANNLATGEGGSAVYADNASFFAAYNTTIAYNNIVVGATPGAVYGNSGNASPELNNSIIAKSGQTNAAGTPQPGTPSPNCAGTINSGAQSYNMSDDNTCQLSAGNNSYPNTNPQLSLTLKSLGGRTKTLGLAASSPAIDKGKDQDCLDQTPWTDQRGPYYKRMVGDHCDIGAYEYRPVLDPTNP